MCFQLTERYSACHCLYYKHAVDRCAYFGRPGHTCARRTILVGYACYHHSHPPPTSFARSGSGPDTNRVLWYDWLRDSSDEASTKAPEPDANLNDSLRYNSDSDESVGSGSVVSEASSATTVDFDAVGSLFGKLLVFGDLRYLWPQVVSASASTAKAQRTIEKLLRRYADDLSKLASKAPAKIDSRAKAGQWNSIEAKASRFVRRSRLNVARRICEAFDVSADLAETDPPSHAAEDRDPLDDDSDGDETATFLYEAASEFLFGTDPVIYLEANVKAFVQQSRLNAVPGSLGIWARQHFDAILGSVFAPPALAGSKRLYWTCVGLSSLLAETSLCFVLTNHRFS